MRLVSWNIRAGGGRRILEIGRQLQQWQPDIVALAEFRATLPSEQLARFLAEAGLVYQLTTAAKERAAVNALLLASRFPLEQIPLPIAPLENSRWLLARIAVSPSFAVGVMHIPNYVSGRKHPFHDAVLAVAHQWLLGPGLLIGDTNSGLPGLDEETKVFGRKEESWFQGLAACGWVDIFRRLKGEERVYTWYSPNGGNGFRIDQAFVNEHLLQYITDARYEWGKSEVELNRRDALSDHAALIVDFAFRDI